MSYNGSGTFVINSAGQPVVTGTVITTTAFNALTADLGTGLSTAITKDGQTTPTANIPMGGFKITGLGAGTAATDAARLSQLQAGGTTFLSAAGTDTITATASPSLTAYATGNLFTFVVANTNTGAVTLNVDGLGAKAITRDGTTALAAADLVATEVVVVVYDGTRFQVVNPNAATNLRVSGTLAVAGAATLSSTLGVTGVASFADGAVGAPGVTFTSDPDNGIFRIGTNNFAIACAGANVMEFKSGGEITMPLQPAFSAYNSATRSNVTGDGTNYTVVYDTEIYDRGGDFNNSTYTFTAPVTGIYSLKGCLLLTGLDNDPTQLNISLVTSNRTYNAEVNSSAFPVGNYQMDMIRDCDMDAGDTAVVKIQAYKAPSSLSANVYGNATSFYTIFQGRLAC